MIIKPHVISFVYILFELWEDTPEVLNCVSWNDKPTQFKCWHTIGVWKSGNLADPAGSIDANRVGWRCESSCRSRCAGNVHQMNSCPPGSAAHSACWNSCHIKHPEKRAHKHYFSWKEQEDVFPIVTIKSVWIFMKDLFSSLWVGDLYRLFAVHKDRKIPRIFHYVSYSSTSIHYAVHFPINLYYQTNVVLLLHSQW